MDEGNLNPIYIILLYIARCVVPLGILLGISYLLRRFGLISKPAPPPKGWDDDQNNNLNGGLAP